MGTENITEELDVLSEEEILNQVSEEMREVDLLDLMMIEAIAKGRRTRRDIADLFDISKQKSRSRMEELFEKKLVGKAELCSTCEELINECECGNYNKTVFYFRDDDDDSVEMLEEVRKLVQNFEPEKEDK